MAKRSNGHVSRRPDDLEVKAGALSKRWAHRPTKTSEDMKACMSDIVSDLLGERIETRRATAVVGASKLLLATVLAEFKYGYPGTRGQAPKARSLRLNA